jgi:hypothetical protein
LKVFPGLGARTWPVELRLALQTAWPVELRFALQTTWPGLEAGGGVVVDHNLQLAVVLGWPYCRIVGGITKCKNRAGESPRPSSWLRALNVKWFSVSGQVSAAFEGYKGAVPLSPLCHPLNRSFPSAPSSSSRLAPCPPTRCRSVSAMQATAPNPSPSSTQTRYLPTTGPVGCLLPQPRGRGLTRCQS